MFQLFDKSNPSASTSLLGDLLAKVSDIGKLMSADKKMSDISLLEHCQNLLDKQGEATSLAQSTYILDRYQHLSTEQKLGFFQSLLDDFGTDRQLLNDAIAAWGKDQSEASTRALHFIAEPKSQDLIRRLNQASNATMRLVNMRTDLLGLVKQNPALKALDQDFAHLFRSWFNRGFLQLQHISWKTPATILEKVIAYEAVHKIDSWDDLRLRVAAPDRRLYGYFHPALGMEPLIFVEVALTSAIPNAINPILSDTRDHLDPSQATTAVFYSISNCQQGLRGISFGNFLIKQVVENLHQEFPNLKVFVTLSPAPGFRQWALQQDEHPSSAITNDDLNFIKQLEEAKQQNTLTELLNDDTRLRKLLAKYLVTTRSPRGGATDPVSRFHLGNGAQLDNIHTLADTSINGMENAWGCMVNYQYRVNDIEKNHEAYVNSDKIIASSAVQSLLR